MQICSRMYTQSYVYYTDTLTHMYCVYICSRMYTIQTHLRTCTLCIYAVVCILYRHIYAHAFWVYMQSYAYYTDTATLMHMHSGYMMYAVVCILYRHIYAHAFWVYDIAVVCIQYRHTYAHVLCVCMQSYAYYTNSLNHIYCMYICSPMYVTQRLLCRYVARVYTVVFMVCWRTISHVHIYILSNQTCSCIIHLQLKRLLTKYYILVIVFNIYMLHIII